MLSIDRVRQLLIYDPETGVFSWRQAHGRSPAGSRAATLRPDGHRRITIDGKKYRENRLAVFYMTGEWPPEQVDHRNRVPSDNRWSNLRNATPEQNSMNTGPRRYNMLRGSYKQPNGRYRAQFGGKRLGTFDTQEEAHEAWKKYALQKHADFVPVTALSP
jgi:hypothetical protein